MSESLQARRLRRIWSAMIAAIIVTIAVSQPEGPTLVSRLSATVWAIVLIAFLAVVWVESAPRGWSRRTTLLLAALESVLVLLMQPITPAIGSEGALLAVVAFVVGRQLAPGMTLLWIVVQSVLLLLGMTTRFGMHHASGMLAMSVPFQLLAAYTGRVARGELTARDELLRANAELRATQHLLADSNRAAERFRISRELHDVLGHRLTALSLHLEIATVAPDEERRQSIARAYGITKELLGEVRDVVDNLRDGAHVDLVRALETLTSEVPRPRVHLELPPTLVVDSGAQAHVLLRCAQEVVTNAMKHSDARHLWLQLHDSAGGVEMVATDDGRGAVSLRRGHGLSGLEERLRELGGQLEAGNAEDGGFRVRVLIPAVSR